MITFRQYLLEYSRKENSIFNISKIKNGDNGKDFNRAHKRKNINTTNKEYVRKYPIPNGLVLGDKLIKLLNNYKVKFAPGKTKKLGNSSTEVKMFINSKGQPAAFITTKKYGM